MNPTTTSADDARGSTGRARPPASLWSTSRRTAVATSTAANANADGPLREAVQDVRADRPRPPTAPTASSPATGQSTLSSSA